MARVFRTTFLGEAMTIAVAAVVAPFDSMYPLTAIHTTSLCSFSSRNDMKPVTPLLAASMAARAKGLSCALVITNAS